MRENDWGSTMAINCIWEHNGSDTLLYAVDFVGAYTRGETLEALLGKWKVNYLLILIGAAKKQK